MNNLENISFKKFLIAWSITEKDVLTACLEIKKKKIDTTFQAIFSTGTDKP